MTSAERRERARAAAYAKHAKTAPHEATAAAVQAMWARYEAQADPDGTLDPAERRRRAKHLIQADLARGRLAQLRREREAQEAAAAAALAQQMAEVAP